MTSSSTRSGDGDSGGARSAGKVVAVSMHGTQQTSSRVPDISLEARGGADLTALRTSWALVDDEDNKVSPNAFIISRMIDR